MPAWSWMVARSAGRGAMKPRRVIACNTSRGGRGGKRPAQLHEPIDVGGCLPLAAKAHDGAPLRLRAQLAGRAREPGGGLRGAHDHLAARWRAGATVGRPTVD